MASPGQNLAKTPENPEIHEIPGALEMATGKGAGIAKDNFAAFVKFNPFRRPWKPEIQEMQGALEMASGKGAGIAKSTSLMLLWCSARFGGLGSRKNKKYKRKGAGHCKFDGPPFRRPWKSEIREIQGALELASGKGAGIAKSTKLVLLWCSPHFGGHGSRKSKKYSGLGHGNRKGAGIAKSTILVLFLEAGNPRVTTGKKASIVKSAILVLLSGSSHFGGLGSRKSKNYKEPWKPAALVPIWRPKIGIWEPCRKWSIS